ncbi:MAG: YesL family protein, partial [Propionibacteriaceae bacterium]|nr:YesL family protein [Propionibacteriaceae bacterium]
MTAPAKPDTRPVGEQLTNKVYAFSIEFTYIAIGSILWLICSLPIVTIGAASVGLHALMLGHRMAGRRQYARPFFAAFKASFRLVTLPWLVLLVLMTVFTLDALFYLNPARRTAVNLTLGVVQLVLLAIALVLATYVTALAAIDVDDALSPHCQERRHGR